MAAGNRDLCTLAEVREAYGLKAGDATELDTRIERVIKAVSEQAHRVTGREFVARNNAVAPPPDPLNPPAEARTLKIITTWERAWVRLGDMHSAPTAVELVQRGTSYVSTLDIPTYVITDPPSPGPDEPITKLELLADVSGYIRVTARWGFPRIPDDVREAVIEEVCIRIQANLASFTETFNLEENRVERPRGFASKPWDTLQGYRRMGPIYA